MRFRLDPLSPSGISLVNENVTVMGGGSTSTTGGASVSDEAYGVSWNGVVDTAPSKNALYDKLSSMGGGGIVETIVAGGNIDVDATDPANPIVSVESLVTADITDITATATELNYVDGVTSAIQTQIDGKSATSHTHVLSAGATDVTSSAAELNILDGATLSTTELNYVDGVTSAIQTQLDNKQPLDADLTALAAANNSTVLAATTASFLTADETKLDGIEAGADVTDAANVAAAGAVMNTGNESVGGIKTFTSDPIVPDEAYGASWSASTEVPTKNAVYNEIQKNIAINNLLLKKFYI